MTTFHLPLLQIDAARLDSLIADTVREGRQLDYKEALPGGTDDDKYEFLSDISSFANAIGGDIIYGVRERRDTQRRATGEPEAVVGLPGLNLDAERLRLENLVRDAISPRMPPLAFHVVPRDPDPSCLVLRIARSWTGLHMVTFRNRTRFYGRNSSGKYPLDVAEIRAGFLALETAQERVRRFRADRVARVLAGETPIPIAYGPKVILHGLPVAPSADAWARFRLLENRDIVQLLPPLGGYVGGLRFNLDGFVTHTVRDDASINCYSQLFRDGGVEGVGGGVIRVNPDGRRDFYGAAVERHVVGAFQAYQRLWALLGVEPPIVIALAISGIAGCTMRAGAGWFADESPIERDTLFIPEIIVENVADHPATILRPLFDAFWNAGGWPESPYYRDGLWTPPR